MSSETGAVVDPSTFSLRPSHAKKFRPQEAKPIVRSILESKLENQEYKADDVQRLSKEIADSVRDAVRDMDIERYKILVNCMIGEQRGEGVRVGCKMFWDSDTDNHLEEVYMNKSIFAIVSVFALYVY